MLWCVVCGVRVVVLGSDGGWPNFALLARRSWALVWPTFSCFLLQQVP